MSTFPEAKPEGAFVFHVVISTDNSAFHAEGDGADDDALRGELADVLRRLRVKVTNALRPAERGQDDPFVLFDSNGAMVGSAWFEEE